VSGLHPNAQRVVDAAAAAGVPIEVVEYPAGTRTAQDAAAAIGCTVAQIVKSLVFEADGELVLALVSGVNQLDPTRLAEVAGAGAVGRADADGVRRATGFPIGGVPPFGHDQALRVWCDETLLDQGRLWAAAGTPRHVFAVEGDDLVRLSGATVADLARPA
jgi:prolyl-tRNA editing enzyme YbaK/EbsC (Cys-tRNA(Pro) deacylase)